MRRLATERRSTAAYRFSPLSIALLAAMYLVASCGGSGETQGGESGPVQIQYSTGGAQPPNEMEAAIFGGELEDKGVLSNIGEEYTLDLTFAKGTPEAQTLLVSGEVDMATLAFSTIATAAQQDAVPEGFSVVAGHFVDGFQDKFSNTYLVLEGSGIESIADVAGKTVGVNAIGSAVDVIFRRALTDAGLNPERDVDFVEVGFGAMGQALRDGRVDVGSMVQPFHSLEMQAGGVEVLTTAKDVVGENAAIAVVARNDFLEQNPEAVKAFLADWVAGLQWLEDPANREEAMQIISNVAKTPVDVLDLFYGTDADYYRDSHGCPRPATLQKGVDAMVEVGYLQEGVDIASMTDDSYLPDPGECDD